MQHVLWETWQNQSYVVVVVVSFSPLWHNGSCVHSCRHVCDDCMCQTFHYEVLMSVARTPSILLSLPLPQEYGISGEAETEKGIELPLASCL